MNYYISDLHLFHKNVTDEGTNFDNRPFETLGEMHSAILKNWNSRITGSDHVYILGDLCWKHNEESIAFVSKLKGNKHLICGNHDNLKDQRYRQLFCEILNYKELKDTVNGISVGVVLSHFPIAFWNHQHKYDKSGNKRKYWAVHLYGHVHDSNEQSIYREFIHLLDSKYNISCEAYNVGCMINYMNYTPRTLVEILNMNKKEVKV